MPDSLGVAGRELGEFWIGTHSLEDLPRPGAFRALRASEHHGNARHFVEPEGTFRTVAGNHLDATRDRHLGKIHVGKSVAQIATETGRDVLDVFLDLALAEDLETVFERREVNSDEAAMSTLLNSPHMVNGQSDGGAHVVFRTDYSYPTYMLSHWVRDKGIITLEEAIRKMTFVPASLFGLYDRGLVRPGLNADLMVFDPDTVGCSRLRRVRDQPARADRLVAEAMGIRAVIVNGTLVREEGHDVVDAAGPLPGRVLRGGRSA